MMVATGPDPKAGSVPKGASSHGKRRPSTLAVVLAAYGIPAVSTRVAQSAEEVEKIARALLERLHLCRREVRKNPRQALPSWRSGREELPTT